MTVYVESYQSGPRNGGSDKLDAEVLQMFGLVREMLRGATEIFLAPSREAARAVVAHQHALEELHRAIDQDVLNELVNSVADDLERRHLLLIIRILPEIERSGDLAEHIAAQAAQGLVRWITPRGVGLISRMGAYGLEMWDLAAGAYAERDASAVDRLRALDDELDDLHVSFTAELAAGGISIPVALEMGLIARYFERLGDHAFNVTRRLEQLH